MKIVINRCYGGFSLSGVAIKWLVQNHPDFLQGTPIKKYYGSTTAHTIDLGDGFMEDQRGVTVCRDGVIYSPYGIDDEFRSHPALIECVEALGKAANGRHAELKIVEIPDGISWEIDDYDGMESIEESHSSWS